MRASFVDHVCKQRKHQDVYSGKCEKNCFVRYILQDKHVVQSANDEKNAKQSNCWTEQSHGCKIHPCTGDQLCESYGVSYRLDMTFANSLGVAYWCK